MKKMQGIVDPISLSFILIMGIATAGSIVEQNADDQQMAQDAQTQTTEQTQKILADN